MVKQVRGNPMPEQERGLALPAVKKEGRPKPKKAKPQKNYGLSAQQKGKLKAHFRRIMAAR
jgi:hypothetical protein